MSTIDKIVEEAVEGAKGPFIVSWTTESNMRDAARRAAEAAEQGAAWEDWEFMFREIALQPDDTLTAEAQATKAKMREIVKPLIDAAVKSALEEATWDSQPQA